MNPGYAKTLAMYFEERAMQLYYHVKILKEPTHIYDTKRIIRALLSFKQTSQFDMTYKHPTWMELMKEEPALWESVVQYGQFQSIPPEETEQMKRQRRKNTFPKTQLTSFQVFLSPCNPLNVFFFDIENLSWLNFSLIFLFSHDVHK